MDSLETEGPVPRAHILTVQIALISAGLGAAALALMLKGWQIALAGLVAFAFVVSAFLGLPSVLLDYVRRRRGLRYQTYFSIAVPLLLLVTSAYGVWMSIDVAILLGDWPWTAVAVPICYAIAAVMNLGVLVRNLVSLRPGTT